MKYPGLHKCLGADNISESAQLNISPVFNERMHHSDVSLDGQGEGGEH